MAKDRTKEKKAGKIRSVEAENASEAKPEKPPNAQMLAYPLVLRGEHEKLIASTLAFLRGRINYYLKIAYENKLLELFDTDDDKKAYKILEPWLRPLQQKEDGLPSRIFRCMLEVIGRTLRALRDKKHIFDMLMSITSDPKRWNYRLLMAKNIFVKAEYVKNISQQTVKFVCQNKRLPASFYEMQKVPQIKKDFLTYAADDEQAIQMRRKQGKLFLAMKVRKACPKNKGQYFWGWIEFSVDMPDFLAVHAYGAPDLRISCRNGHWLPILDFKLAITRPALGPASDRFVTVDWGVHKLLTLCVFDRQGQQVSRPMFLRCPPLQRKLLRLRKEIACLQAKRDLLDKQCNLWKKYNRAIACRWRKVRALDAQIAHLASNVIVFVAQQFGCTSIYIEWLKSLKASRYKPDTNWLINSTVRQAIYDKLAYKARMFSLRLEKPVNPAGTSQYCPRCGYSGHHCLAPNSTTRTAKHLPWFVCPSCHFNADRDYVACCNLARKVLFGNSLKDRPKAVAYQASAIPALLFPQGTPGKTGDCRPHPKGWITSVFLTPKKICFGFNHRFFSIFGSLVSRRLQKV